MKIEYNPEYKNNLKVTEFIEKLPSRFEQEGSVLFSGRNVIKSFVINPADNILKQVVVKRYKFPNAIQRIAYSFFRASKAARAFHNAAQLRTRGIDTPGKSLISKSGKADYSHTDILSRASTAPPV